MFLLLASSAALASDCPEQPLSAALGWASTLRTAYTAVDEQRLEEAHAGLQRAIPCIREEVDPTSAFELHRGLALGAFVDGLESQSRESWAAVRALQPDWVPPSELMPEGHPLLSIWRATDTILPDPIPLQEMPRGGWRVDGVREIAVPAARAFVLQGFDASGAVVHTGYYYDPADIPKLEGVPMISTKHGLLLDADAARRARIHKRGSVAAGSLAAAALLSLGVAAEAYWAVYHLDPDESSRAVPLAKRANGFSYASGALGAASLATGAIVWTVHW